MKKSIEDVLEKIPPSVNTEKTLHLIRSGQAGSTKVYFGLLKKLTNEEDKEISEWLDINVKTFRSYKNTSKLIKQSLIEHVVMLISLMKHGVAVFGDYTLFKEWLEKDHFHFDGKRPVDFIVSISGIKFVDDKLTAMEYGDNA